MPGTFRPTAARRSANLSAGSLTCFGFAVEASFGRRPMRYAIVRRFGDGTADTWLFVTEPGTLAGTHVRIAEDRPRGRCEVRTFVPTMRSSLVLAERHVFGCLPLTEIGYLDLMAWRHPSLAPVPEERPSDLSWSRWSGAEAYCHLGPAATPGLTVTEAVDPGTGTVVARAVDRLGEPAHRWEVLEPGGPDAVGLPRLVRACGAGGGWTEFRRVGAPFPVDPAHVDAGPERLLEDLGRHPRHRAGPAGGASASAGRGGGR
ncbi:hypothetical protein [Actinomadura sp. WMMB 499]|uniref:hypothetical protein n=1 Tax=Actinomadura sp. WMMB 499 TaxID=1219491 RepID=UPI00124861DF|nr:hypothetical protein [Actinomadura sp. WMMB 499]QFG22924.1 hypothetical protein F7P10_19190 [Actinomadura sp. WMMB 499]